MTGGVERYQDRGIIPRSISTIFKEIRERTDVEYNIVCSYLEIYNETGYDLLAESSMTAKGLEDLPKVTLLEDSYGNSRLKNLSVHKVATEEDCLNLLFTGDTNRAVGETPMNMVKFANTRAAFVTLYRHLHALTVSSQWELRPSKVAVTASGARNCTWWIWLEVNE